MARHSLPRRWTGSLLSVLVLSALASAVADDSPFTASERSHWSFQPVVRPDVPAVAAQERVRTAIDAFVLRQLEERGLTLSAPATKTELLRRAKFDLLGLPPTPEEVEAFLADDAPDAYERLVDRLLESPHYGETWGRAWLDLVRFAETAGFNADPDRPLAYKYRDYVIDAFNSDTPYDRFIREQLAGDELFPDSEPALVATGYNRMWPDESNASNVLLARQDALNDLTGNVGSVFLGLTIGCAQCHDHKFDPILQTDFYQLQAFFTGIVLQDRVPRGTSDELAEYRKAHDAWLAETAEDRALLHQLERDARAKAGAIKRLKFPAVVLEAIDTEPEQRTAFQRQLVFWSERQIEVDEKQLTAAMNEEGPALRAELQQKLAELEKTRPRPPAEADVMAVVEVSTAPPATHLLAGGSYDVPREELAPGFPMVMAAEGDNVLSATPPRPDSSGRRSALAAWLSDPRNPLVPRVMVNRLWLGHFGQGLVENANDFGTQTAPPSHPELLDWLADEFVDQGWSIKQMHRLIMTSEVYRQSTHRRAPGEPEPAAWVADSGNRLYWHYPRRRLTAERVRDALLTVSERIDLRMYGPGVRPDLPPGFNAREAWKVSEDPADQVRRSVYIYAKRNLPYPLLSSFDLPDMHESCAARAETVIAPQALMLLNSEMVLGYARSFAERLVREHPEAGPATLVERAYLTALGRRPDPDETALGVAFLEPQDTRLALAGGGSGVRETEGGADALEVFAPAVPQALVDFCHVLLNANEFLYID